MLRLPPTDRTLFKTAYDDDSTFEGNRSSSRLEFHLPALLELFREFARDATPIKGAPLQVIYALRGTS